MLQAFTILCWWYIYIVISPKDLSIFLAHCIFVYNVILCVAIYTLNSLC